MREYVIDIECDSLDPTRIHCVCVWCEGWMYTYTRPEEFNALYSGMSSKYFIGHNILSFDVPVLRKLWGTDIKDWQCFDTLVMSKLYNPKRKGGHSLESWGKRLGFPKGEQPDDWSTFTPEMLDYCRQDVRVTDRLYKYLKSEGSSFSPESLVLEQEVRCILNEQEANGFQLDVETANDLLNSLRSRRIDIGVAMQDKYPPLPKYVKDVVPKYKKDGSMSSVGIKGDVDEYHTLAPTCLESIGGVYSRVNFIPFNPASRPQIAERLKLMGWVPKNYTEAGSPIVDEGVLEALVPDYPDAQPISEFMMLNKRAAQVESWLKHADDEGRVHGRVDTLGTRTTRMSHFAPNVSQVPSSRKPYGKICRSCWTVPDWDKYSLVGVDASGLELRMLAHYMRDEDYIEKILYDDIHSYNQHLAGLDTRDQAKTFIYALLYGGGDEKLGTIVQGTATDGRNLRRKFMDGLPAYSRLLKDVTAAAKNKRRIKALDGRYLHVDLPHTALNTLLQGGGSIVMKEALRIADDSVDKEVAKWVANSHDEMQVEVLSEYAEEVGMICVCAIRVAGKKFNLNCPMDAKYKVGRTWLDTH